MKTRSKILVPKILPAVCCIAMLSACASNKTASLAPTLNNAEAAWSVKPMVSKSSSDKPESWYQMGRYYQGQNRYDLAIAAYQKVLAADQGFVEARNGLGVVYSRQGKYLEAIEAFNVAIKQSPNAAHLYSNLGYAYYLQGQYAASVAALKQSTELNPANKLALNNLALAYAKIGKQGESLQAFSQAANLQVADVQAANQPVVVTQTTSTAEIIAISAPASKAESVTPIALRLEDQLLSLPKDRGVVRTSSPDKAITVDTNRMQIVQVEKNVYELHSRSHKSQAIQLATANTMTIDDKPVTTKARLEVANGNGVTGLASKVGQFFTTQGYPAIRLTNQKPFQVRTTQIEYRAGYQVAAQRLQLSLPESPQLVQRNDLRADVALRLVLGKDMATRTASFDHKQQNIQVALNTF